MFTGDKVKLTEYTVFSWTSFTPVSDAHGDHSANNLQITQCSICKQCVQCSVFSVSTEFCILILQGSGPGGETEHSQYYVTWPVSPTVVWSTILLLQNGATHVSDNTETSDLHGSLGTPRDILARGPGDSRHFHLALVLCPPPRAPGGPASVWSPGSRLNCSELWQEKIWKILAAKMLKKIRTRTKTYKFQ